MIFSILFKNKVLKVRKLSLGEQSMVAKLPKVKKKVRGPSKEMHFKDLHLLSNNSMFV